MEWHQYLREERARKLSAIKDLSSGRITLSVRSDGEVRDTSTDMIAEHEKHIAEIEEILRAADEPFER